LLNNQPAALGALASTSKSSAQMDKSWDVGKATKKRSALPVNVERRGPNSSFSLRVA